MSTIQNEKQVKKAKNKKSLVARIMDRLDKKLKEQTKGTGCCDNSNKGKGKPCC